MKDYGTVNCKNPSCKNPVIRSCSKPKAVYCSVACCYSSRLGKKLIWKNREIPKIKVCHGIVCRGEKKFLSYKDARICYRCKIKSSRIY